MAKAAVAGPGRPPDSSGEETRAKIIEAAKERFGLAGFKETSNKHIAERAGLTAATIYYYFKNKSDLFLAVHGEMHPSRQEEFLVVMSAMNFGSSQIAAESSLEVYELCTYGSYADFYDRYAV